jgi:ketosteroid isomerase-like protein
MHRIARAALFVLSLLFASTAHAEDVSSADVAAIRGTIESQLHAFAADHDAEAYSYAAPLVQGAFPTVDQFMAMVKRGYQPIYRNTAHRYPAPPGDLGGRLAQRVILQAADGKAYEAAYFMQKQPDGSWKISGCVIKVLDGFEA